MGVKKEALAVEKKRSKSTTLPTHASSGKEGLGKISAQDFLSAPVHSGPAAKKAGGSSKTQSPPAAKSGPKSKAGASGNHSRNSDSGKMQGKSKGGSSSAAGKKVGSGIHGRGLLDTMGETVCREVACEGLATSGGYCRLHYIKNWKKIKRKELILREKKLNQYIEELVAKYPDKYIEAIRQDLANDKDFAKVIYDLDLDEGVEDFDIEGADSADSLIDTIKRDFDDEGEVF